MLTHVSTVLDKTICGCTNMELCDDLDHPYSYRPAIAGGSPEEGNNPANGYLLFGKSGTVSSDRMNTLAGGGSVMIATITFAVNPSVTHGSEVEIWTGTTEHIPDNNFIRRAPTSRYTPNSYTHFHNAEGHEVAPVTITFISAE